MHLEKSIVIALAALGLSTPVIAFDYPTYENGVLTLPRVDTPEQIGRYQGATLQLTEQGDWQLTDVREMGQLGQGLMQVIATAVEVVKSDGFPVAVLLRASGDRIGCGYISPERIHQRRIGNHFDVLISVQLSDEAIQGEIMCAAAYTYFKSTVVLDTYGLSAGTYTYDVGGITGSFTLDLDNKYTDDCDATVGCYPR